MTEKTPKYERMAHGAGQIYVWSHEDRVSMDHTVSHDGIAVAYSSMGLHFTVDDARKFGTMLIAAADRVDAAKAEPPEAPEAA